MAIAPALNPAWTTGTSGTAITSSTFSPAANSLIVVESQMDHTLASMTPSISDSVGLTWTQIGTAQRGISGGFAAAWWAFTVSAQTNMTATVEWSAGSGNTRGIKVRTYTGTASASAVISKAQNSSGTNNLTVNVTNTNDQCRICGTAIDWNALGAPTSTDDEISYHAGGAISGTSVAKAANTTGTGQTVGVNFDAGGTGTADWAYKVWEIVPAAGGGTDLPYDGEGETPFLNDAPAKATLDAAYAGDAKTPFVQDAPARSETAIASTSDGVGPSAAKLMPSSYAQSVAGAADGLAPRALVQPARVVLDEAYASDLRAPMPVRSTAQTASNVAAAADGLGGRPLPGIARGVLSIEMGTDSATARPSRGLATYELTGPGAEDLSFSAIGVPPRAPLAPARSQLDEFFRALPRPAPLADTPARSAVSLDTQADGRTLFVLRNAAARVLANQSLFALASGGWLARGLALATLGGGAPLPVDVVAVFDPVRVNNDLAPPVVKADFAG